MHRPLTRWPLLLLPLFLPLLAHGALNDDDPDDVCPSVSALSWQFKSVPTQPSGGSLVASLPGIVTLDQTAPSHVVAFANADSDDDNGAESGVTWEANIKPTKSTAGDEQETGLTNKLQWLKVPTLQYSSPPSRSLADASVVTWGTEMNSSDYGSNRLKYGVVMFGGLNGMKALGGTFFLLFSEKN